MYLCTRYCIVEVFCTNYCLVDEFCTNYCIVDDCIEQLEPRWLNWFPRECHPQNVVSGFVAGTREERGLYRMGSFDSQSH